MTTISPLDGSVPISIQSSVIFLSVQMRSTMHDTTSTRPGRRADVRTEEKCEKSKRALNTQIIFSRRPWKCGKFRQSIQSGGKFRVRRRTYF